jgi:polysaccharide export outer membrane protein
MKRLHIVLAIFAMMVTTFTGCKSPTNISYFQDIDSVSSPVVANPLEIKVRPGDKLSIIVKSKDPALAELFNLATMTRRLGYSVSSSLTGGDNVSLYTVDGEGMIDFPVLGLIKVGGLNRREVSNLIKNELISHELVKDPTITVEFDNMFVSVLGEVNNPGRYDINRDCLTILDVIGMAGDLTIFGKRENVVLIRNIDGKTSTYHIDLTKIDDIYRSPAYNIQQNDVIYVEPNDTRARQSTVNGNNVRSTSFWISFASLLTSVGVLIVSILN